MVRYRVIQIEGAEAVIYNKEIVATLPIADKRLVISRLSGANDGFSPIVCAGCTSRRNCIYEWLDNVERSGIIHCVNNVTDKGFYALSSSYRVINTHANELDSVTSAHLTHLPEVTLRDGGARHKPTQIRAVDREKARIVAGPIECSEWISVLDHVAWMCASFAPICPCPLWARADQANGMPGDGDRWQDH